MKKGFYFLVASFLFTFVSLTNVDATSHHYTFDTKGGSPATIDEMDGDDTNGDVLDIPEVIKEGSIFGGWCYFDENMATPAYPDGMEVCLESNEVKNWHPETVELYAKWITAIDTINVTIKLPEIGTKIESGSTTLPIAESDVTVPSGAGYIAFPEGAGLIKSYDDDSAFVGTIEEGNDYYVELMIVPTSGSVTSETKIKINEKENYKVGDYYVDEDGNLDPEAANNPWGFLVYAKVTATAEESDEEEDKNETKTETSTTTYKYLEGAEQTYTLNADETASFRIDADYSLFENGGRVYVDDTLVDSKNYTAKSGSTIITFTKEFMSNLSTGSHTLKVVFNDEGVATTSFTVKAQETASANTEKATEKSTKNPQTVDSIKTYIILLGLSIIGLTSLGISSKEKRLSE